MSSSAQPAPPASLDSFVVIPGVRWFHLSDPSMPALDDLAARFGIHALQVEDCRHQRQTARMEEHEKFTFIVIKPLVPGLHEARQEYGREASAEEEGAPEAAARAETSDPEPAAPEATRVHFEDFDIFLGPDFLLTVDEGRSTLVPSVLPRLQAEPALQTPDRIAHALIDTAVDQYLPALDRLGDFIDELEDRVIGRPTPATLREIFRLKRALLEFRRVATAMREAVNGLLRRYDAASGPARAADRELRFYYRDVYDHLVRVIDFVETYRDLLTGSLDIYLSAVANRTNQVMKILTIWGTIALPLLIVTSFYGMNVKLPFQEHPYVVAGIIVFMVASALAILEYFRRRHWF